MDEGSEMLTAKQLQRYAEVLLWALKTARRKAREALSAGAAEAAAEAVRAYSSVLDKAVKRGVIKKNTAIRRKQRANEALRKLEA